MSPLRSWVRLHTRAQRTDACCAVFLLLAIALSALRHYDAACYSMLWAIYCRLGLLGERAT